MRKAILIACFFLSTFCTFSQGGMMLEAGGPAGYFSMNYISDRFEISSSSSIRGRIGYGTYRLIGVNGKIRPDMIVPLGFSYRYAGVSRLNVGGGVTLSCIQRYIGNSFIKPRSGIVLLSGNNFRSRDGSGSNQ